MKYPHTLSSSTVERAGLMQVIGAIYLAQTVMLVSATKEKAVLPLQAASRKNPSSVAKALSMQVPLAVTHALVLAFSTVHKVWAAFNTQLAKASTKLLQIQLLKMARMQQRPLTLFVVQARKTPKSLVLLDMPSHAKVATMTNAPAAWNALIPPRVTHAAASTVVPAGRMLLKLVVLLAAVVPLMNAVKTSFALPTLAVTQIYSSVEKHSRLLLNHVLQGPQPDVLARILHSVVKGSTALHLYLHVQAMRVISV